MGIKANEQVQQTIGRQPPKQHKRLYMIELRYKVARWERWDETGKETVFESPKLQYRDRIDENTATEWIDVPTEYVEV